MLVERASAQVVDALRPRLMELELENDRILGEAISLARTAKQLREQRDALATERDQLLQDRPYTYGSLPGYVDLPTDAGGPPTIVFDLHGTLSPVDGFPMTEPPHPGVKDAMDEWAAHGVCIVVCTAAMDPSKPAQIIDVRQRLAWEWINRWLLPVRYVTGKVGAHLYYDDRMVYVNQTVRDPWGDVPAAVEAQLAGRAELSKDGQWRLLALPEVGTEITDWPDADEMRSLKDCPRGYSTPVFNVDIHRCLLASNSSENDSGLRPGAREVVNAIYDAGFTVHASCAGWDPASHEWQQSRQRLAGLQRTLQRGGLKYDEITAKLHGTVFVDDKGLNATSWLKDQKAIWKRMAKPGPEDEVTTDTAGALP